MLGYRLSGLGIRMALWGSSVWPFKGDQGAWRPRALPELSPGSSPLYPATGASLTWGQWLRPPLRALSGAHALCPQSSWQATGPQEARVLFLPPPGCICLVFSSSQMGPGEEEPSLSVPGDREEGDSALISLGYPVLHFFFFLSRITVARMVAGTSY